ncbi:hypothetical protein [Pasteuria penetrans]|nr:hypothetical protein [Pasteuria penetrans]
MIRIVIVSPSPSGLLYQQNSPTLFPPRPLVPWYQQRPTGSE